MGYNNDENRVLSALEVRRGKMLARATEEDPWSARWSYLIINDDNDHHLYEHHIDDDNH